MPGKMVVILGALSVLWMVFVASQAFKIEIFPKSKIVAQIGASVSLTCSTTGCESPSFSWRTQIDSPLSAKVRNEGNTSTLTIDPVSFENEHSYLCTATCGSGKEEKEIKVQIYSFPKDPEIYLSGPLEVGKLVTVTCLVPDVYPFDRLEMDLLKDNQNLKSQYFLEPIEKKSLETKSLEVTFTPTNEDTGKALVCRAKLLIDEIDIEYEERETTQKLQVYIAPRDTAIFVNPSTKLQEGGSVTMTCSSEGLPAPQILWSKKLDNSNLQFLSENATLTLIAMRMEDSGIYVCEGVNTIGRNRKEVELIVQEKSFTVEISPGPQIVAQVGGSVMLTCRATGCESPSFSWRTQIDSPLSGKVSSEGTTSTLTLSPVSFENEHSYLCTVTCGRKKLEKGIKVDLYSFPRDPEIEMSGLLVDGNPVTISCKVPHVYPLDRLEIELLMGDSVMKSKNFLEDVHKNSLETKSLEMTFIPTTEDIGKVLICQAKLNIDEMEFEPKQRQSTQTIHVNVAPRNTTILVSPSVTVKEGSSVNITCSSNGLPAPKILLSRQLNNGDLQPLSENTTLTLISTTMEDSGIYVCEGINQAGVSRKEVELVIQVAPKDIKLTAFPSESVKEGETVIISCTCRNVPKTWIILKKKAETGDTVLKSTDGAYTIHKVQLEDAGVYECESKNDVGLQLRSITLDVKELATTCRCNENLNLGQKKGKILLIWPNFSKFQDLRYVYTVPPRNTTISIRPSRNIKEGENITITCKTFSHPPSVIILKRVDVANEVTMCSKNGTFTLYHVTQNDKGVYVISASNEVGGDSGWIKILVTRRESNMDYFSPELLMLYCASSLIIPAIGMIIYFARKANMKGSYSLVEAQKSKV